MQTMKIINYNASSDLFKKVMAMTLNSCLNQLALSYIVANYV